MKFHKNCTVNNLDISDIKKKDKLYLIKYSQIKHPDFSIVTYEGCFIKINDNNTHCIIKYVNTKGIIKKIDLDKVRNRLFLNKHEMARALYDCFIRREVEIINKYKILFLESQNVRPELWI